MSPRSLCRSMLFVGILLWIVTEPSHTPILTLSAILVHEGGHLIAARLCGIKTGGFAVDSLGARLALTESVPSYKKELLICAAGPLANLCSLAPISIARGNPSVDFFMSVSLALAMLNLLPIKGFDGGHIFHCLLSFYISPSLADFVCMLSSFFCLFILWCTSVYLILRTGADLSLFLFSASIFTRVFLLGKMP